MNGYPAAAFTDVHIPRAKTIATTATGAPTGLGPAVAHGKCGPSGTIAVELSNGGIVTCWVYCPVSTIWRKLSVTAANYSKTFPAGGGIDWILNVPVDELIYLECDTNSLSMWTDLV